MEVVRAAAWTAPPFRFRSSHLVFSVNFGAGEKGFVLFSGFGFHEGFSFFSLFGTR
jgi:hypothetical protein